jgi:DedD protein
VAVAVAAAPPPVPASAPRTAALTAAAGVPRPQVGVVATPAGPAVAAGPSRASSAADSDDRFVVQVGAYTDPATLREARQKVERLGLKTYTQVIETDAGRRTRVRVGPFDSRADADEAARRLKAAGLPANILVL